MFFKRLSGAVAVVAAVSVAGSSAALASEPTVGYGEPASGFSLKIGGSVGFAPKYEGSDEYRVTGFPLIIPSFGDGSSLSEFGGRMTFRGIEDVRFRLLDRGGFEIGPVFGYKFERDDEDGDRLVGLGDVEGGLILGGYVGYRIGGFLFDVAYRDQVTGDADGYRITAALSAERQVNSWLTLRGRVGATYADDDYMSTFFGVTAAQAALATTVVPQYTAEAGVKDVHIELGATLALTPRLDLKPRLRYSRLVGDAADSPIVETEDQLSGSLALVYSFGR